VEALERGTPPTTEHLGLPVEQSKGSAATDSQRSGHERDNELRETSGAQFVEAAEADLDSLPNDIHVGYGDRAGVEEAMDKVMVAQAAKEPVIVTAADGPRDEEPVSEQKEALPENPDLLAVNQMVYE